MASLEAICLGDVEFAHNCRDHFYGVLSAVTRLVVDSIVLSVQARGLYSGEYARLIAFSLYSERFIPSVASLVSPLRAPFGALWSK